MSLRSVLKLSEREQQPKSKFSCLNTRPWARLCTVYLLADEEFAFVSWPEEGDGTTFSVISPSQQRILGSLAVGVECRVITRGKEFPALVHATGK